ncbi:MAG: AAA family ATPase [Chloroflexota bacterium]|nr:AAA family ATPase [Chloroflexota bacterium]
MTAILNHRAPISPAEARALAHYLAGGPAPTQELAGLAREALAVMVAGGDNRDAALGAWLAGREPAEAEAVRRAIVAAPVDEAEAPPLVGVLASAVQRQPIYWLWSGRLARGKLAMLDGDPGVGKSLLTCDLAARITTGRALPGDEGPIPPAGVVLVTPEDDPADTTVPRLALAGADLDRIRIITTIPTTGTDGRPSVRALTLPGDLPALEAAIRAVGAVLVVIDPVMACLDAKLKSISDQEVRQALTPLADLAARTKCAVLIARHPNKGSSTNALYKGAGSIAFIGACRTGFLAGKHPDGGEQYVLAPTKSNIGRLADSLAYRIVAVDGTPRVEWVEEPCHLDAQALLVTGRADGTRELVEAVRETNQSGATPKEIAAALGMDEPTQALYKRLQRAAKSGALQDFGHGKYGLPVSHVQLSNVQLSNSSRARAIRPSSPIGGGGGSDCPIGDTDLDKWTLDSGVTDDREVLL